MTSHYAISNFRMILGVIVGSLVPVICFATVYAVSGWRSAGDASLALLPMLVGTPIAIMAAAVLAPIVWWWNRAGRLRLYKVLSLGGVASALPFGLWSFAVLIQGWSYGALNRHDVLLMSLWVFVFFALGMLGACVAWLIAMGTNREPQRLGDA